MKRTDYYCDLCGKPMCRDEATAFDEYKIKVYRKGLLSNTEKLDICFWCMREIIKASKAARKENDNA